jgi:hypothetical protein
MFQNRNSGAAGKVVDPDDDFSNIRSRVLSNDELHEWRDRFEAMARDYEASDDKRRAVHPVEPETQAGVVALPVHAMPHRRAADDRVAACHFEAGTWFVPKENVKGSRGKKRDHFVYLSRFALRQFRALHARTGKTRWCFPGRDATDHVDVKSVSKEIGDRQRQFEQRKALANRRNDDSLARRDEAGWSEAGRRDRGGARAASAAGEPLDLKWARAHRPRA